MEEFILNYKKELVQSGILLLFLLFFRFIAIKLAGKIGARQKFREARIFLIKKYMNIFLALVLLFVLGIIWSFNYKDVGLVFSSVFAMVGVALFAQWSILSNITAGFILFFSYPIKIGDRVEILDSDFPGEALITDIRTFTLQLRLSNGAIVTYPNSLLLQKGVKLVNEQSKAKTQPKAKSEIKTS